MALTDRVRTSGRGRGAAIDDTSLMIPAGLCLRAAGARGGEAKRKQVAPVLPSVNLLSPWSFGRIAVRRLRTRFAVGCLVLVSVATAAWGLQMMRVRDAEALLAVETAETSRLTDRTNALQPVKTFVAGVEQQKATVSETMASEIYFSKVLRSMSDAAPSGVVLDSLAVTLAPPAPEPAPAPAKGSKDKPPAAVPATPSPCPGPDPFQTRPVVGCITVSGTAGSRAAVGALVVALRADASFVEPFISTTTTADATKVTFSGSVGLSKKVYSSRYAKLDQLLSGKG
jgi:Tfp pilus assembly protein PilN